MNDVDPIRQPEPQVGPAEPDALAPRPAAEAEPAAGWWPPIAEPPDPGRAARASTQEVRAGGARSRLGGLIVVVSLVSAILASAVTAGVARQLVTTTGASPAATSDVLAASAPGPTVAPTPIAVTRTGGSDPVIAVAKASTSSVVTIDTTMADGRPGGVTSGTGSGFVVDASGLILTNNHVVEGAQSLTVTFLDGHHYQGTVVAADAALDLAVVRIRATGLVPLALGSADPIAVGETVIAIGSPLGTFTGSVTSGVLSATERTITVSDELTGEPRTLSGLLQTDAAINPGNSGGPILDLQAHVVGIATATSTSAQGLGFAVPITQATSILERARQHTT